MAGQCTFGKIISACNEVKTEKACYMKPFDFIYIDNQQCHYICFIFCTKHSTLQSCTEIQDLSIFMYNNSSSPLSESSSLSHMTALPPCTGGLGDLFSNLLLKKNLKPCISSSFTLLLAELDIFSKPFILYCVYVCVCF